MYFQHDGAPPHYTIRVRELLNELFPNRWLGRDGPVTWPPRSPDLTPLDYYLWGHMKTLVYETKVQSTSSYTYSFAVCVYISRIIVLSYNLA